MFSLFSALDINKTMIIAFSIWSTCSQFINSFSKL